ncbi:MAG: hypothetical protein IKW10_08690 [Oscillospiraceae bacterium]|nr:hypothetical protein [Oscillospiraceae bacterium]
MSVFIGCIGVLFIIASVVFGVSATHIGDIQLGIIISTFGIGLLLIGVATIIRKLSEIKRAISKSSTCATDTRVAHTRNEKLKSTTKNNHRITATHQENLNDPQQRLENIWMCECGKVNNDDCTFCECGKDRDALQKMI